MASTAILVLFFIGDQIFVQAEVLLVASRSEHEGSVAIVGDTRSCRSAGEAGYRCELDDKCRGIWFDNNGTEKKCQVARCPYSSGTLNPVAEQAGFFFVFYGAFGTGNSISKHVPSMCMYMAMS